MALNNDGKKPSDITSDEEIREYLKEQEDKIHKAVLAQKQSAKKGKGGKAGAKKISTKPGSGNPKSPKKATAVPSSTPPQETKSSPMSSKNKLNKKGQTLKGFVSAAAPKKK
jgi:hypothetical protein